MNLIELYEAQRELDAYVGKNLGIDINDPEYVQKRVFALKVELAEFANEVGWFKYWKQSHKMDWKRASEEHADVTHFFLSIGASRGYDKIMPELSPYGWENHSKGELFAQIMANPVSTPGEWLIAFEQHIALGLKLGFSIGEMRTYYYLKRQTNFERQKEKY